MTKNAVITGRYKGYNYIVKKLQGTSSLQNHWFNGYVEIPKGHKLYNVHYEDLYSLEVHGGLTFSRMVDDKYWLGFDTAHYGDNPIKCDEVYVEKELESLIDQIKVQYSDKATPLRPYTDYFYYFCQNCDKQLGGYGVKHNVNYCSSCGYKVDWSEISD